MKSITLILQGMNMRNILIIVLAAGSVGFAVTPVPRHNDDKIADDPPAVERRDGDNGIRIAGDADKHDGKAVKAVIRDDDDDRQDRFHDADSNNVNDQREKDLRQIKQLKTKFKDIIKQEDKKGDTDTSRKPRTPKSK